MVSKHKHLIDHWRAQIAAMMMVRRSGEPATDCDDESTYPGAPEVVDDGVDQDCDNGDTCYRLRQ